MEYDFNIRLSILVGRVWDPLKGRNPVIRGRTAVLRAWIREGIRASIALLKKLYLGDRQAGLDLTPIKESLYQLIENKIDCKTSLSLFGKMGQP